MKDEIGWPGAGEARAGKNTGVRSVEYLKPVNPTMNDEVSNMWKLILGAVLLALAFALSGRHDSQAGRKEKAPGVSLTYLDGKHGSLQDLYRKGPVIIDFWATWCGPCVRSMPHMQALYEKYEKRGVTILGINEDGPRNRAKVKPFLVSKGLQFPVALDEDGNLGRKFKITSLPTTLVINQIGEIEKKHVGYRPGDEKELDKLLADLLEVPAEKAASVQ